MPSVNFYLNRPFKKGSGKFQTTKTLNPSETMIFLYVSYPNRHIIKVSTGEKIKPKDWNFERKCVRSSTAGSLSFNSRLAYFKSEVLQTLSQATTENVDVTLDQLRILVENVLDGTKPKFDKKTFIEYFDEFLLEKSTLVKTRTYDKFNSFKNVITEYLEERKINSRSFMFESIDHSFDPDFRDYLIHKRGNRNNTISKHYEILGVLLKWGIRKKYTKNTSFQDFGSVPRDKTEIVFLELDEIKAIEKLKLSGDEDFARTIFLFGLYTGGQRLSDVQKLRHKDIVFSADKKEAEWRLFQFKGKKTVKNVLPLLPQAILYLMKYYKQSDNTTETLVFPEFNAQELNDNINVICKSAGITQQLTFRHYSGVNPVETVGSKADFITMKSARKSFVSICMALGMSSDLIISYTGHTTTKTMQRHYLGISPKFKRDSLFKFWNNTEKKKPQRKK